MSLVFKENCFFPLRWLLNVSWHLKVAHEKEMSARDLTLRRSTDDRGNTIWQPSPLIEALQGSLFGCDCRIFWNVTARVSRYCCFSGFQIANANNNQRQTSTPHHPATTTIIKQHLPCQAALNGGLAILDGIHRLPLGALAGALGTLLCDRAGTLPDGTKMVPEAGWKVVPLASQWDFMTPRNGMRIPSWTWKKHWGVFGMGFTGHDTEFPIFPCFQCKLTGKDGREKGAEFCLLFKNEGFLRFRGDGGVLGASFWHFHHITYHHLFPSSFSNLPSGAVESLAAARHQRSHASAPEVPPAAPCLPRHCHRWAAHGGEELVGGWTANAVPLHRGGGFGMFLGVFVGLYTSFCDVFAITWPLFLET